MNQTNGYLSYYGTTIVCAYMGSEGFQVNSIESPVPGFSVQPAVGNLKSNTVKSHLQKDIK
ncbi:MAG: hypothetical protein JSR85_03615 [Proteobacteria bacterium]|nr:hypothetical protein [Pseudomonadota bacterium]